MWAKLKKERDRRTESAQLQSGLLDGGTYRAQQPDGSWRWYRVHLRFYPTQKWCVEELDKSAVGLPIAGTYRPLDDELKSQLKGWL